MITRHLSVVSGGGLQAAASVGLAATVVTLIAVTAPASLPAAVRLAVAGLVLLAIGLVVGSRSLISLSALPILGAALASSGATEQTNWVRSALVGSLWFIASELAWEAIDRRDGALRPPDVVARRAFEVATVVALALGATTVGFAAVRVAPTRTIGTVGAVVVIGLGLLALAARHVEARAPGPVEAGQAGER